MQAAHRDSWTVLVEFGLAFELGHRDPLRRLADALPERLEALIVERRLRTLPV